MAELDDKLKELSDIIENTKSSTVKINEVILTTAGTFSKISDEFSNVSKTLNSLTQTLSDTLNKQINALLLAPKFADLGEQLRKYGELTDLNQKQLMEVATILGRTDIASEIQSLTELIDVEGNTMMLGSGALEEFAEKLTRIREEELEKYRKKIIDGTKSIGDSNKTAANKILLETKYGKGLQSLTDKFKKLEIPIPNFINSFGKMSGTFMMLAEAAYSFITTSLDYVENIYSIQRRLGVAAGTAVDQLIASRTLALKTLVTPGPILSPEEVLNVQKAFMQEFGRMLSPEDQLKITQAAKLFGTSADVYIKAQRSFLGAGGPAAANVTQQRFISQFRAAGLTANQALIFAAENANLVAIAGSKYADALARAAANAQRIGVSLSKTEQFADNLVSDFEGGLERFSELRAMGVEVDFNRLAQVAAMGTPEEVFTELSREMEIGRAHV